MAWLVSTQSFMHLMPSVRILSALSQLQVNWPMPHHRGNERTLVTGCFLGVVSCCQTWTSKYQNKQTASGEELLPIDVMHDWPMEPQQDQVCEWFCSAHCVASTAHCEHAGSRQCSQRKNQSWRMVWMCYLGFRVIGFRVY